MYLHVGNNQNILIRSVIGIFDADSATVSTVTRKYLSSAEAEGAVRFASVELPKSFILYREKDGTPRICFSQLSTASLAGRIETGIPVSD
ncbi:MAG: DUF370 domain-containing protein [Ruminococcaceae bacterium]|nr:DUF370 domain-containing protein [Oscillospiraceae bacterium]